MTDPLFGVSATSPKVEAIKALTAAGFALIPVCRLHVEHQHHGKPCKTPGKVPTFPDWASTPVGTYHEGNIVENYGVVIADGWLVVDIDPRNFEPGDNPVARLFQKIGPLDSFTVKTGGGGLHIYLRVPKGTLVINELKEYAGVEFKSVGRQVVGPGSVHKISGKEYVIAAGSPNKIAEAPEALLALIRRSAIPFDEAGTGEYMNDAATQGRFVDYLEHTAEPSVMGKGGDHNAFRVACAGRDMGLPPATCWDLMMEVWNKRCSPEWEADELKAKVINAYKFATGAVGTSHPQADFKDAPPVPKGEELSWVTGKGGAFQKCFQNLVTFLRYPKAGMVGVFGYNEFTGRVEFQRPAPWHRGRMPGGLGVSDTDLKMLKGHLAMKHGFEMPVQNIEEAVTIVANGNRFHPVKDYLTALKWDGTPRLATWLHDYLGVEDNEYSRACATKVLCAAVKRVFHPGCKFNHVLVLEGAQQIGKSTVVEILGDPWSGDFSIDPHNKDTIQLMQGRWFVELAEMEVTRRADLQALKAFITRRKDEARLAYGRTVGEFPRQSVFIGTINPAADGAYLADETGNDRWWPVWCAPKGGRVDFAAFKGVRDQLFAEAVALVNSEKEALFMDSAALAGLAKAQAGERHAEHAWTERIGGWMRERQKKDVFDFTTAREVYLDAMGGVDKQLDRRAQLAIASALRELGWERGYKRIDGIFTRGYVPLNSAPQKRIIADVLGSFA